MTNRSGMRLLRCAVAVALLSAAVGTAGAGAVTRGAQALRHTVSYCVHQVPPSLTFAQARAELDAAITEWRRASSLTSAQALTLVHHNPCQAATAVRIETTTEFGPAHSLNNGTAIRFNSNFAWWNRTSARQPHELSYRGVLLHEMGHTFGMGHVGGSKWSYDGLLPTMVDTGDAFDSVRMESLQQDDMAMAAYVRGGGAQRFWSANPGLEVGWSFWSGIGVTMGTNYAYTGGRGARLRTDGDALATGAVYDPFAAPGTVAANMTAGPTYAFRHAFRNPNGGALRGLRRYYEFRYLRYDQSPDGGNAPTRSKAASNADATFTSWSALTLVGDSVSSATMWHEAMSSVALANSATNDATVLKPRFIARSDDGGPVYADALGVTGGMTS